MPFNKVIYTLTSFHTKLSMLPNFIPEIFGIPFTVLEVGRTIPQFVTR